MLRRLLVPPRLALALAVIWLVAAGGHGAKADDKAAAVAKAKELIEITGMSAVADQLLHANMQQLYGILVRLNPDRGAAIQKLLNEHVVPEFRKRMPEFVVVTSELYARHFTAAELDEIIAFYRTPVGRKAIEKLPVIAQEALAMGQTWGDKMAREVMRELAPKMQEQGLKSPEI